MKNIVVVTIALGNDGAERVLTELMREWSNKGHHVTVIQTHANRYGNSTYEISDSIKTIYIQSTSKNKIIRYLQEINSLIHILRENKSSTVISFLSASSFISAIASLFVPNKMIFSERNNPKECPIGWLQQKLRNLSFYFADRIVFQTEEARQYFSSYIQKKGIVIPNPINGKLPDRYIGEKEKLVVTACRLHPQKNLFMLIDAFKKFHNDFPDYSLVIYGQGVLEQELKQYVYKLNLEEKIIFPGFERNVLNKLNKASMYVSSSNYEGISNSMLEAMALGLPVIVTDCPVGGARMIIQNNENGILVPVNDTEALYLGMKRVAENPQFAKKLADKAYLVREKYPLHIIANEWLELL